jgi:hypothetical protein
MSVSSRKKHPDRPRAKEKSEGNAVEGTMKRRNACVVQSVKVREQNCMKRSDATMKCGRNPRDVGTEVEDANGLYLKNPSITRESADNPLKQILG